MLTDDAPRAGLLLPVVRGLVRLHNVGGEHEHVKLERVEMQRCGRTGSGAGGEFDGQEGG